MLWHSRIKEAAPEHQVANQPLADWQLFAHLAVGPQDRSLAMAARGTRRGYHGIAAYNQKNLVQLLTDLGDGATMA
ncbi:MULTISPECIES: hypothetical protein [Streptomyces]|uniref:hypothetical protein n=1 Tax=Streptomyces TaxID=1883 RepID=UPI0011613288|nr:MULTISPECIES: hypothetical protein [unclassified Streptomyces]NUV69997.1 hypothetical protein [Streptomyces sp. CAI-121]NUW16231.1 hypothetical protein [Streptomyces sp. CAI-68]QNQ34981.1 hypothetical protein HYC88_15570 [Streptomyces sp. CB00271]